MTYVEAHAGLRDHPKTKKAARLLAIPRPHVIGHLVCLWWWCQEYAHDGNLSEYSAEDIAEGAEWQGEAAHFVESLITAGFLTIEDDGALIVHDWYDYGGKLFKRRQQGAARTATWRARHTPNSQSAPPVTVSDGEIDHSDALVTRHQRARDAGVTQRDAFKGDKKRQEKTRREESRPEQTREPVAAAAPDPELGKAIRAFEREIGAVTASIREDMIEVWTELESGDHGDWWYQALQESAANNKRSWKYMRAILDRCLQQGVPPIQPAPRSTGPPGTYGRNGNGRGNPAMEAARREYEKLKQEGEIGDEG